jgi:hypothetical protein
VVTFSSILTLALLSAPLERQRLNEVLFPNLYHHCQVHTDILLFEIVMKQFGGSFKRKRPQINHCGRSVHFDTWLIQIRLAGCRPIFMKDI